MDVQTAGPSGRDLFWRRLAAAALDVAVLVVLGGVVAVAAYAASGGALRSTPLLRTTACAPVRAISAEALDVRGLPAGFRPNAAALCRQSLLGLETGRYLVIREQRGKGAFVSISRPIDRQGRAVVPVVLDWAYPLAFILVLAGMESALGATAGKRLMGLKVADARGRRPGLHRTLLRNLLIYGAWGIVLVLPLLAALLGIHLSRAGYVLGVGVFGLLGWAPLALLAQASPQALYDRWAGVDVARA